MSNLPIAIDAMGGDFSPGEIVAGAISAQQQGLNVVLVGQPEELSRIDLAGIKVVPASQVIAMDADPGSSVRTMKDSSLVRSAELVRDGLASGFLSAGNTGATMASALLRMGRIKGVVRPAIATPIPVPGAGPTVLLDAGANAECTADMLMQFAQMGTVYSRKQFGIENPRVGLLSIGEEDGKGNALAKEANELFRNFGAARGINFIGNVEGRDIMSDSLDVVITDGFTGNVVLKSLEGAMKFFAGKVFETLSADKSTADLIDTILPVLLPLADQLDPASYGGAVLLGVEGVCIIAHGSSKAKSIHNACKVAHELVNASLVDAIRDAIALK